MKKHREPEALRELHKIREEIHKEAVAMGVDRYYEELNKKSGWLLDQSKRASRSTVRERPARYKAR